MRHIGYSKHFLGGNLEGLSVRCHLSVPAASVAMHLERLSKATKEHPGSDGVTGDPYWVYNVACVDDAELSRMNGARW